VQRREQMKLEGIHHITAITADAQRNVDFYADLLGLRLVKKSVNQDQTSVYHLFYADEVGEPGSDITFFEYPDLRQGRPGAGMVHRIVWRLASAEALAFWEQRLAAHDPVRTGASLRFRDPEGLEHELAIVHPPDEPLIARHPEIPAEVALQGVEAVRAYAVEPARSRSLLEQTLGYPSRGPGLLRGPRGAPGRPLRLRSGPARATSGGGGHRPPRRLGGGSRGDRAVAAGRGADRSARDARDRPALLPLGVLPRALRGAV